jgi:hypothetical protein
MQVSRMARVRKSSSAASGRSSGGAIVGAVGSAITVPGGMRVRTWARAAAMTLRAALACSAVTVAANAMRSCPGRIPGWPSGRSRHSSPRRERDRSLGHRAWDRAAAGDETNVRAFKAADQNFSRFASMPSIPLSRQWKLYQAFARRCARHMGDTHGDTLGDTVSPSLYPPARVQITAQNTRR